MAFAAAVNGLVSALGLVGYFGESSQHDSVQVEGHLQRKRLLTQPSDKGGSWKSTQNVSRKKPRGIWRAGRQTTTPVVSGTLDLSDLFFHFVLFWTVPALQSAHVYVLQKAKLLFF